MQNNILYKEMYKEIQNAHYILLVTHKNPDPDTLSSALSLSNFLFESRLKHKVFNISKELPRKLDFLCRYDKISFSLPKYYDLIIYLDCANEDGVGISLDTTKRSICIDHHQSNNNFADINIVDTTKSSTAELLYNFYEQNGLKISKNNAECLYTGIYDDSLAFSTPRTNKKTFQVVSSLLESKIDVSYISEKLQKRESLAKFRMIPKIMQSLELYLEGRIATVYVEEKWIKETGVVLYECDDVVDMVLSLGIVEVVAYFRIIDNSVRVSLRSKNDIDVSVISAKFNGGGHKNAAGFVINTTDLKKTRKKVVTSILDYIED